MPDHQHEYEYELAVMHSYVDTHDLVAVIRRCECGHEERTGFLSRDHGLSPTCDCEDHEYAIEAEHREGSDGPKFGPGYTITRTCGCDEAYAEFSAEKVVWGDQAPWRKAVNDAKAGLFRSMMHVVKDGEGDKN